jgi:hypothetical protein
MDIVSYQTGPIACRGAVTADSRPDDYVSPDLSSNIEVDRRKINIRPGKRHKYTPLRFGAATGGHQVGRRGCACTRDRVVKSIVFRMPCW